MKKRKNNSILSPLQPRGIEIESKLSSVARPRRDCFTNGFESAEIKAKEIEETQRRKEEQLEQFQMTTLLRASKTPTKTTANQQQTIQQPPPSSRPSIPLTYQSPSQQKKIKSQEPKNQEQEKEEEIEEETIPLPSFIENAIQQSSVARSHMTGIM